jgi:hypothetical protein
MILPDLHTEERPAEVRIEAAEIPPDLPLSEIRRRLLVGAENLVNDPRTVSAAWLAPIASMQVSSGIGEA